MRVVGRAKRLVNELTSTRLVAGLRVPHDLASWAPTWKTELLEKLLAGGDGVLVDVGANVGQTLLDYVHLGGRGGYVGFEPLPAAAACVQRVIDDNGLSQAVLVPIALSDRPTVSAIHIPEGDLRSASLERDLRPRRTTKIQWVSAHALDDIWSVLAGGRRPAAVKVDVEGAELPALRGGREGCSRSTGFPCCAKSWTPMTVPTWPHTSAASASSNASWERSTTRSSGSRSQEGHSRACSLSPASRDAAGARRRRRNATTCSPRATGTATRAREHSPGRAVAEVSSSRHRSLMASFWRCSVCCSSTTRRPCATSSACRSGERFNREELVDQLVRRRSDEKGLGGADGGSTFRCGDHGNPAGPRLQDGCLLTSHYPCWHAGRPTRPDTPPPSNSAPPAPSTGQSARSPPARDAGRGR